ncbi:hypothetical protein SCOCK_50002 [Actinacidiphila cocklensis]|uniref:Uncharacterized protein n=1 Tax=Actinacidiphila cocklensis TaxID=887465 RepID=A0A9W4GU49_9ACTN|nr:hypothetical protein SCOCK_50002 [Actinacidiphila cocklensis]
MDTEDLLPIGQFAQATGLTVTPLRHRKRPDRASPATGTPPLPQGAGGAACAHTAWYLPGGDGPPFERFACDPVREPC